MPHITESYGYDSSSKKIDYQTLKKQIRVAKGIHKLTDLK